MELPKLHIFDIQSVIINVEKEIKYINNIKSDMFNIVSEFKQFRSNNE